MKNILSKTWKPLLSLVFGCIAFIFWGHCYPAHISFQEQYQLFLFSCEYGLDCVSVPGGLADYIAEFLTQFFYYRWLGALLIAVLLVVLQRLVWYLAGESASKQAYYLLSFIPSVALWSYMCDENALLSLTVAILLALLAIVGYERTSVSWKRILYAVVLTPALYWMVGPACYIFMGYILLNECLSSMKSHSVLRGLAILLIGSLWTLFIPLLTSWLIQYPLFRLLRGLNYYRFPNLFPMLILITGALFVLIPLLIKGLPRLKDKTWIGVTLSVVVCILGGLSIYSCYDAEKEEIYEYDYLTRNERWDEIIRKAEEKSPDAPFSVACLNLALAKTDQLGDRMFQFYQNGTEGLLAGFQRDFVAPLATGEVYYHLGMVNAAQQLSFEAMEAIPNYRKSGRLLKRLAQTNLINGQYKVAEKYLHKLAQSLFYRSWANETLSYLADEKKINSHPEYGWLRKIRYDKDFLFSENEMDMMLGMLFEHNYQNKMAFEYLLAYVLLQRDVNKFMQYYPLGKYANYDHIPRSYQETLVYTWTQNHNSFQGIPWSISGDVMNQMVGFIQAYMKNQQNKQQLGGAFGRTYWYYLMCRN